MSEELRDHDDHDPLEESRPEEGGAVAARANEARDDRNEQRRAASESSRHDPRRETASIGKPFESRSDRSAVDERGADAGQHVGGIELRERRRRSHVGPTRTAQHARDRDEETRPQTIDQPAVERLNPCLKEDEQREGRRDLRQLPSGCRLNRLDEERPRVLKVGDHDHRHERRPELHPAIVQPHRPASKDSNRTKWAGSLADFDVGYRLGLL